MNFKEWLLKREGLQQPPNTMSDRQRWQLGLTGGLPCVEVKHRRRKITKKEEDREKSGYYL